MTEHHDRLRVTPDLQQAEALRRRLRARLTAAPAPIEPDHTATTIVPVKEHPMSTDPNSTTPGAHRRRYLMAAAGVLVLAGGVAVAINLGSADNSSTPGESVHTTTATTQADTTLSPATTPSPTTIAATTTMSPPALSDAEIAQAALLTGEEYQPGWVEMPFVKMTMSGANASQIPACEPYLDTAFVGPSNPAAEAYRVFTLPPDFYGQYVVVFPTEAAATAMFDDLSDETFLTECAADFFAVEYANGEYVPVSGPSDTAVPTLDLPGDQVWLSHGAGDFTRPDGSPGHFDAVDARIRVGRLVMQVTGADPRFQTNEEFTAAVSRAVERATAALNGTPIP